MNGGACLTRTVKVSCQRPVIGSAAASSLYIPGLISAAVRRCGGIGMSSIAIEIVTAARRDGRPPRLSSTVNELIAPARFGRIRIRVVCPARAIVAETDPGPTAEARGGAVVTASAAGAAARAIAARRAIRLFKIRTGNSPDSER